MKSGIECFDVTKEYYDHATPGQGILQHEEGTDENDQKISEFLFHIFGGDIKTLRVENRNGKDMATPDALWNEMYWEYKSITSIKSVDNRIRQAWHQLRENAERKGLESNRVGILIDISNQTQGMDTTINATENALTKRIKYPADIIIIENGEIIMILRK